VTIKSIEEIDFVDHESKCFMGRNDIRWIASFTDPTLPVNFKWVSRTPSPIENSHPATEPDKLIAPKDADVVPFPTSEERSGTPAASHTSHIAGLQNQLRDWLGANVEIKLSGKAKDKGKIIIDFGSNDDFERIVGKLQRAA
jgi:hypothetical protein